jgi:hypothetical protein
VEDTEKENLLYEIGKRSRGVGLSTWEFMMEILNNLGSGGRITLKSGTQE